MAALTQLIYILLVLGLVQSWTFPSFFDQDLPSNSFRGPMNTNTSLLSIIDDMNKIMATMRQRFQRFFGTSSFPMNHMDNWMENRRNLDGVEPVCTTTTDSPSTSMPSMKKSRRKKFRNLQTTTCVKEMIFDGKRQLYKEVNVTDDKGILISQSKIYQVMSINTMNNTMNNTTPIPIDINGDKDVISY